MEGPIRLAPLASIAREMLDGRHASEGVRRNEAARGAANEIGIDVAVLAASGCGVPPGRKNS